MTEALAENIASGVIVDQISHAYSGQTGRVHDAAGEERHVAAHKLAVEYLKIVKVRVALKNQLRGFREQGVRLEGVEPFALQFLGELGGSIDGIKREIAAEYRATPFGEFVRGTPGLGPSLLLACSRPMHPIWEYRSEWAVYKVFGLHVVNGSAERRVRGGDQLEFSPMLRSVIIHYAGARCLPGRVGSPYRPVYDARRERTAATHPVMLAAGDGCESCDMAHSKDKEKRRESFQTRERKSAGTECYKFGGIHWTLGHQHADALRVMTKAILRDVWRVGRGLEPSFGGRNESTN